VRSSYISKIIDHIFSFPFSVAQQPPQWAKFVPFLRLHDHTQTHHARWDQSICVISPTKCPLLDKTQQISMPLLVFERAIPASEQLQDHALGRTATEIGIGQHYNLLFSLPVRPYNYFLSYLSVRM